MENQNNNNFYELDQLKAQYETLKEQLDQQEIVNDRLMKSSIKHSADFYGRYRRMQIILYPLAAIIGMLCIQCFQGNHLSLSLFWLTFCSVCFTIELWLTRKLKSSPKFQETIFSLHGTELFHSFYHYFRGGDCQNGYRYKFAEFRCCGFVVCCVARLFCTRGLF